MRVLHVIPSLAVVHGGPSVALPVIERALSGAGVEVETATTDDEGRHERNAKSRQSPMKENGVLRHYFRKQTEFYKMSLPLGHWVRSNVSRFDVVHIHAVFSYTSVAAARAARHAGVPYVIRPLGVLNNYGMTQRRALLKRLSFRWVEAALLRDASAVHFTHLAEQEEAERLEVPLRSVVIPLGVEEPLLNRRFRDEAEATPPTVLFLSRIDPKKNLDGLLKAWKTLRPEFAAWKLVIAGRGPAEYVEELQELVRALGMSDSVKWTGHVEGEAKARLVAQASVFTLPSHSENFGIAAAEALLAGKACVFSVNVPVGADAAANDAAHLTETTPGSLAAALAELMANAEQRRDLGARAKRFAATELSVGVMGQRLMKLYEDIRAGS